jgi:hypothetical protein
VAKKIGIQAYICTNKILSGALVVYLTSEIAAKAIRSRSPVTLRFEIVLISLNLIFFAPISNCSCRPRTVGMRSITWTQEYFGPVLEYRRELSTFPDINHSFGYVLPPITEPWRYGDWEGGLKASRMTFSSDVA